ncbi:hypothetical protein SNEBB_006283 [Seison nebaliae]|nr:hypothetical protein SNEBB_006283 [Seison nebaliae]
MENIYRCLLKPRPGFINNRNGTAGNVLCTGLLTVAKNVAYKSNFGVVGDYLLAKTCVTNKNIKAFKTRKKESVISKCERLIRSSKVNANREITRWHVILNDLFELKEKSLKNHYYKLSYYPEINMMNIEFKITALPRYEFDTPRPFLPDYQQIVGKEITAELKRGTSFLHYDPDVIFMSLSESLIYEIHPVTLEYMATSLIDSFYKKGCCKRFVLGNFPVVVKRQYYTVPSLKNNENLIIELPFHKKNAFYQIKAISIALDDEDLVMFNNLKDTPGFVVKTNSRCTDIFFSKVMEDVRTSDRKVFNYLRKNSHYVLDALRVICEWLDASALSQLGNASTLVHTFSLIQRMNQWILFNDQYSLKIDDIEQLTDVLKPHKFQLDINYKLKEKY